MQYANACKAYITEYTLGLISVILTAHAFFFTFAGIDSDFIAFTSVNTVFLLAALIIAVIGVYQLNKNNRIGGVLLTTAGCLNVLSCIFNGILMGIMGSYSDMADVFALALVYTIACAALLLTGGIKALAKKHNVPPPAAQGWYYPEPHPGYYPPPHFSPPAAEMPPPAAADSQPKREKTQHDGYTRQPYAPNTMPPRKP